MNRKFSNQQRLESFFATLLGELEVCRPTGLALSFAVKRQMKRARKRARIGNSSILHNKAVDDFKIINSKVGETRVSLRSQVEANARHFITVVLENFTSSIDEESIQQTLNLDYLFDNWRFGPGASYGIKGTHTVEKIEKEMTCSAPCEHLVRMLRSRNTYFRSFDYSQNTERFFIENKRRFGTVLVRGSRLTTVPKNEDTMRTIAIEPLGNMALQLAAGVYLENALRSIGLDISTQQTKNKFAARRGSMDGSLATIDLKSASDMISIDLVRRLMPSEWFWLLSCLRSEEIELPDGTWQRMNMISTMGNGFTFPLMTLIIVALIYGFRATRGGPNLFIDWTDTCVYGDDIIIPTNEYEGFTEVLHQAGLVVNHDKSYVSGPFRESCGGDFYEGYDVTPFYAKSLSSDSEVYVVINQLLEWSGRNKLLPIESLRLLISMLTGKTFLVPEWRDPSEGILTALAPRRYNYLARVPYKRKLLGESLFECMLAVGGYISDSGTDLFYSPRTNHAKVKVRKSRLPQGYLDGFDPGKRSKSTSLWISTIIEILN